MGIAALDAPGARSPVSTEPSFSTTWWVMLSTLCQTTICPAGTVAGFGEKDCAPFTASTLIVTTPEGLLGLGLPESPPLPPLPAVSPPFEQPPTIEPSVI